MSAVLDFLELPASTLQDLGSGVEAAGWGLLVRRFDGGGLEEHPLAHSDE